MDKKRKKYESDIISKKRYNSRLSTFQIDRNLHDMVKNHCELNNLKVRDFLHDIILEKLT